jgi:hypothetical protein
MRGREMEEREREREDRESVLSAGAVEMLIFRIIAIIIWRKRKVFGGFESRISPP